MTKRNFEAGPPLGDTWVKQQIVALKPEAEEAWSKLLTLYKSALA